MMEFIALPLIAVQAMLIWQVVMYRRWLDAANTRARRYQEMVERLLATIDKANNTTDQALELNKTIERQRDEALEMLSK